MWAWFSFKDPIGNSLGWLGYDGGDLGDFQANLVAYNDDKPAFTMWRANCNIIAENIGERRISAMTATPAGGSDRGAPMYSYDQSNKGRYIAGVHIGAAGETNWAIRLYGPIYQSGSPQPQQVRPSPRIPFFSERPRDSQRRLFPAFRPRRPSIEPRPMSKKLGSGIVAHEDRALFEHAQLDQHARRAIGRDWSNRKLPPRRPDFRDIAACERGTPPIATCGCAPMMAETERSRICRPAASALRRLGHVLATPMDEGHDRPRGVRADEAVEQFRCQQVDRCEPLVSMSVSPTTSSPGSDSVSPWPNRRIPAASSARVVSA